MNNQYIKWFGKLALFIVVFVVSDYLFGIAIKAFDKRADKMYPEANKTTYLLNHVNSDVLIVGASEVEFSFRPDILIDSLGVSVYNCGQNGQRLYYQTTVVNSIIDRYIPKLLVWSISPNCLTPDPSDMDRTSVFKPYYHENKYCRELLQKRSWYEKYKMLSYYYTFNSEFHSHIINAIIPAQTNTIYGYRPPAKSEGTPSLEEEQWIDSPDELSISLFENTLNKLNERGVHTVFIFTPRYSTGDYCHLTSYSLLKDIITRRGYELLEDYYNYPPLMHDYYFKDKDHLTEEGVVIYSQIMGHEMIGLLKH